MKIEKIYKTAEPPPVEKVVVEFTPEEWRVLQIVHYYFKFSQSFITAGNSVDRATISDIAALLSRIANAEKTWGQGT